MYRITASRFGEVHEKIKSLNRQRGKGKVKVASLVMSFVEPAKLDNVPAVEWGKHKKLMLPNLSCKRVVSRINVHTLSEEKT